MKTKAQATGVREGLYREKNEETLSINLIVYHARYQIHPENQYNILEDEKGLLGTCDKLVLGTVERDDC